MKTINQSLNAIPSLTLLDNKAMVSIEGGSFWEDLAYVAGVTLKCLHVFTKTAAEFQASLPPNLKK